MRTPSSLVGTSAMATSAAGAARCSTSISSTTSWKRYDYPRWQFTNHSADIRELCCWALDLADVPRRQSNWNTISVSTRAGVARLDDLIGLKC